MSFYDLEDDELNNSNPESQGNDNAIIDPNTSSKANDMLKNKLAENAKKNGAAKKSLATAIGPIIFWAIIILVIIIIIIGIVMFFMTMPGMVMEKIKTLGKELAKGMSSWFGKDTTTMIDEGVVYTSLDYLEEMGYDLKGFGFLTDYMNDTDLAEMKSSEKKNGATVDEKIGVIRDDDGKIVKAASDFMMAYQISDNYVYTIKNENLVTSSNFLGKLQALGRHFVDFFGGSLGANWTRGLIAIYEEDGGLGKRGAFYSDTGLLNFDDLKIDTNARTLTIEKSGLFNNNKAMTYSLDGWTGRYGMPTEFLLSVHVATMMPDLAYDMANSFETEINLLLHGVDGANIESAFYTGNSYVTLGDIEKITGPIVISNADAKKVLFELKIPRPNNCTGSQEQCASEGPGKACTECEKYVEQIRSELKVSRDNDYNYYIPYLESVTDHWYRDVYFVLDNNTKFVSNDYEYEAIMKERWTLYETDSDGIIKLYLIDENGAYQTDISGYADQSNIELDDTFNNLYIYKGTKAQANEQGILVAKKPVLIDLTDENLLRDLSWHKTSQGIWTAYKDESSSTSSQWEAFYPESDDAIEQKIYTRVNSSGNSTIKQTGEGQRIETNLQIKKMFLANTYFRYDGNEKTAEDITMIREKIKSALGTNASPYGALNELVDSSGNIIDFSKKMIDDKGNLVDAYDQDGNLIQIPEDLEDKYYRISDYSGQVTLNQDSLNAFSMLENTHTLDADYIYRDFKELIVELGYFEKEELSNQTPKFLQWLIPEIGAPPTNRSIQSSNVSSNVIVEVAKKQALMIKGWGYGAHHDELNLNNRTAIQETDCSGYVTSVLIEAGLFEDASCGSREPGAREYWYHGEKNVYGGTGWNYVSNKLKSLKLVDSTSENPGGTTSIDEGKLEPGDIIARANADSGGHVGIYIGEGRVLAFPDINSGDTEGAVSYASSGPWTRAFRVSESKPTTNNSNVILTGYPDRTIDKRENEYGTMIHSKGDIDANKEYHLTKLISDITETLADGDAQESESTTSNNESGNTISEEVTGAEITVDDNDVGVPISNKMYSDGGGSGGSATSTTTKESTTSSNSNKQQSSNSNKQTYSSRTSNSSSLAYVDESASGDGYYNTTTYQFNGVTYKNYKQFSGSYADDKFWNGTYKTSACGPTSAAILASGYGCEEGPKYFGDIIKSSTTFEKISKSLETVGITGTWKTFGKTEAATQECLAMAEAALAEGKPIIMLTGKTKGSTHQYTSSGHFLVILGVEEDGRLIISNPASDALHYTGRGSFDPKPTLLEDFIHNFVTVDSIKVRRGLYIPDEAPATVVNEVKYVGYKGNEAVVSPVTGILLEYGTYDFNKDIDSITQNPYRVNVDLQYGPLVEPADNQDPFVPQIVSDKVGYAKILVLDKEGYKNLESSTTNSWTTDSLLTDNGEYRDTLVNDDKSSASDKLKKMSEIDKTIYGYKEFAELYETYGVAGYVVYVDGFICELPDKTLKNVNTIESEIPEGEPISISNFEVVTEGNVGQKLEGQLSSYYLKENEYQLASTDATDKLNAERDVKNFASSTIFTNEMMFIKEGTIIGRTMTDKELIEEMRENKYGTFEENRPSKLPTSPEEAKDKIIGNYIRIIMRDLDGTIIENVEDYMKLEQDRVSGDLEIHFIDPNSRVDAIYIKIGDKSIYIDGGFYWDAKSEIEYLDKLGVTKIDYYIGSHAHSNHVGAAGPIIEKYNIDTIYYGPQRYGGQSSVMYMMNKEAENQSELDAIKKCKQETLNVGDELEIDGLKIICLGPVKTVTTDPGNTAENANSLILRFEYGDVSFLMAGDTTAGQLNSADKNSPDSIDVDLYKNSHHNGALGKSVLEKISPNYVIFTTMDGYLPSSSYLQTIRGLPAEYYMATTSTDGNVLVTSDGSDVTITTRYDPSSNAKP